MVTKRSSTTTKKMGTIETAKKETSRLTTDQRKCEHQRTGLAKGLKGSFKPFASKKTLVK
jgi:hypothetical protein